MELLLFWATKVKTAFSFSARKYFFFSIEVGQCAVIHQNFLWEKFSLTGGKELLGLQLPLHYVEPDERRKHLVAC